MGFTGSRDEWVNRTRRDDVFPIHSSVSLMVNPQHKKKEKDGKKKYRLSIAACEHRKDPELQVPVN